MIAAVHEDELVLETMLIAKGIAIPRHGLEDDPREAMAASCAADLTSSFFIIESPMNRSRTITSSALRRIQRLKKSMILAENSGLDRTQRSGADRD